VIKTGQDLSKLNALIYFNFFGTLIFFILGNLVSYFSKARFEHRLLNSLAALLIVVMIFLIPTVFGDPTQIIPGKPVSGYLLCLYLVTILTLVYLFTLNVNKPTGRWDSFLASHSYGIYVYQSLSFPLIAISERELQFPVTTGVQRFLIILFFTASLSLIGEYIISKLGRLNSSHKVRFLIK
jgi:surface polysaccharide O-acyltransferase-like enzyme